jgi:hypothetical protein
MRRTLLLGLILLSGCTDSSHWRGLDGQIHGFGPTAAQKAVQQALAQFKTQVAQCRAEYPTEVGTLYAQRTCLYNAAASSPYVPEDRLVVLAQSIIWAKQVDEGQLSMDQFRVQLLTANAQITDQENQENIEQEGANANRAGAAAALFSTFSHTTTTTTNCDAYGNSVSCNSNSY